MRMVSVAIPSKTPFRRFHFLRMDTCRYKVFFRKKKINARNNSFLHSLAFFTLSVYISTNAVDVSIERVINLQLGWKLWFTLCQGGRSCTGARVAPPKNLDSDENFMPGLTLFCRKLRFVEIYALFGDLWAKKVPFWVRNSVSWARSALLHGIYCLFH